MRVAHDSRVFYFNTLHATPKPSRVGFNKHIVRTFWIRYRILESVVSKVFQFPSLTDSQFPPNSQFGLVPSSLWFRTQFPSSKFYFQSSVFQVPSSKVLKVWVVLSGDANEGQLPLTAADDLSSVASFNKGLKKALNRPLSRGWQRRQTIDPLVLTSAHLASAKVRGILGGWAKSQVHQKRWQWKHLFWCFSRWCIHRAKTD